MGGEGAYIADISTPEAINAAWSELNEDCVIEEKIENCEAIKQFSPMSLNTIKVLTLIVKGAPQIETALFRMGNNTVVDNVHSGGICALADVENGILITKGIDKHFREYIFHPVSGKQIVGFQIPQWEAVKQLAIEAARRSPEIKYCSWDVAVTEKGPVLIEGNWDAEFYTEQLLLHKGVRQDYCRKLEG